MQAGGSKQAGGSTSTRSGPVLGIVTLAALACLMLRPPPATNPRPGKVLSLGSVRVPSVVNATLRRNNDLPLRLAQLFKPPSKLHRYRAIQKALLVCRRGSWRCCGLPCAAMFNITIPSPAPLVFFFDPPYVHAFLTCVSPPALAVGSVCLSWLRSLRITFYSFFPTQTRGAMS